ncbi:MFS transporter [Desulfoluna spongiiphila]|uniref:Sugar phosphate permease n=1 Tax=Desulfoluna spongiiphila TaxID=419481 RepID=A0A1G5FMF1_9BACT|nr:MFS transporter [Desulfoluna spongiiphila]SCY40439.1 Sugar phosphate permease [Desulfoluna spongiiphila]
MGDKQVNRWFRFMVLVLGGGTIYKLASLKDAFYVPMQEYFNLTHTQIGNAMSAWGTVASFGFIFSIYLSDRFSKRTLIPLSLIATGCLGFYLTTFPSYKGILITWALFGVVCDMAYWPVLLKSVRLLGNKDEQGRMFGFLEAGRGVVDTIVAFSALAIFAWLGKEAAGFRGAIIFYSVTVIIVGIISYFLIEDDKIETKHDKGVSRNKLAIDGMIKAVKTPQIWMVAFTIFSVYSVFCGLTYFIPFLKEIYGLPVTLVGAYGIINVYGLKMVGGPIGGLLADKKVKSASRYLRLAFIVFIVAMTGFILLPHESMNVYVGMVLTLGIGAIVYTQRAVFFAPMDEVDVPREISGAAMSIGSFIGYAPGMFMYSVYGRLLDRTPGIGGYKHVFILMTVCAVMGVIVSSILCKMVAKRKEAAQKAAQEAFA